MMKINCFLWRYKPVQPEGFMNYFTGRDNLELVDKIDASAALMDIPVYDERFEKQDETLEFTAGDFDVTLTMLNDNVLSENENTLEEFFFPQTDRNSIYVCVISLGELYLNPKLISGRVQLNSITCNKTVTENHFEITFTCVGFLRELADYFSRLSPEPVAVSGYYPLDTFLTTMLFDTTDCNYFACMESLALAERFGVNKPILVNPLYNDIISSSGQNTWGAFKDIARGFGFAFSTYIDPGHHTPLFQHDFPPVVLNCFWRTGGELIEIDKITDVTSNSDLNAGKNYFLMTYRSNVLNDPKRYAGFLMTSGGVNYIADNKATSYGFNGLAIGDDGLVEIREDNKTAAIWEGSANVFQLATYTTKYKVSIEQNNQYLQSTRESFFGCFAISYENHSDPMHNNYLLVLWGQNEILMKTCLTEYFYKIGGMKKMLTMRIRFLVEGKINLGCQLNESSKGSYWLCSLTDFSFSDGLVNSTWVEI